MFGILLYDHENNKPAYRLSNKDLSSIGDTLVNTISTTPAALGHAPRSINKRYNGFKTAEWKAWLTVYGTPCLLPYLTYEYLQNFVVLGHLFTLAKKQQLSRSEVDLIRVLCTSFLQSYELLYYENIERRMKLCTINFHYLIYLQQHLMDAGPSCCWWQFPMERYCDIRTLPAFSALLKWASEIHLDGRLCSDWLITRLETWKMCICT